MFYRVLNKTKKDNHGFTLVELLVTLALMTLIGALLVQLFGSIWKKYRLVENRYIVQTEVKAIMDAFTADSSTGSLGSATDVDLLYQDPASLKSSKTFTCDSKLGTFTEDENTHALTFGSRSSDSDSYSYIFVYDDHMYVLNANSKVARRFSFTDEIPIAINFSVSIDAFAKDDSGKEGSTRQQGVNAGSETHTYLNNGVTITVQNAPGSYEFTYKLDSSFSFKNLSTSAGINLSSEPCLAGYNYDSSTASYNYDPDVKPYSDISTDVTNYPSDKDPETYQYLKYPANVIRYVALKDFLSGAADGISGSGGVGTDCSISILMMNSPIGEGVKNTFRSFRDNVLRGNALGELVIEKYYAWSPTLISIFNEHKLLRDVSARLVTDTAYLIEMAK